MSHVVKSAARDIAAFHQSAGSPAYATAFEKKLSYAFRMWRTEGDWSDVNHQV